ncbi:branched-chain amino acid ABC transporter ATP-binding protein [Acuticoccus sediminis]|uniref:Branched-chain amino acid ABC transporter ATP-binding protein n=1 Tax=Acuticoccus sediminis TaxID=2184697 RepID=A0A8B2NIZ2_9HYPH|nr:ABC transporter ATP-binding protein [Acuticoccus sediminis]RAH99355.1 branched-chain amino acid ABC transporter ATP-binding protein [Acuticoccus sediminis]
MSGEDDHLVEIRDVAVKMGVQQILSGVSLDVPRGSIVAVLGANGVGKTTLMRAISGIYKVTSGEILFEGLPITNLASHKIVERGICQAPEGRQIFSNMSVRENLLLGGGSLGMEELDTVLELFPVLKDRMGQGAGSLSGGEQQMLCIARALMARPKLLLLDEPSLGLAPKLVGLIFDLVAKIREEGVSILIVEQNARGALNVADVAHVIEGGTIVLSGPAAELKSDPRIVDAYLGGHVQ